MGMFGERSRVVVRGGKPVEEPQEVTQPLVMEQMEEVQQDLGQIAREDAQKMAAIQEAMGVTQSLRNPQEVIENLRKILGPQVFKTPPTIQQPSVTPEALPSTQPVQEPSVPTEAPAPVQGVQVTEEPAVVSEDTSEEPMQQATQQPSPAPDTTTQPEAPREPIASVRGVQQRLKDLGYYTKAVDGLAGAKSETTNAIKTFQYLNNFPVTGDAADNIKGLYRVGPKKAEKILDGLVKEEDLWDAVLKAYDGDRERVIENARLLGLRREEGELWQPLDQRKQKAA